MKIYIEGQELEFNNDIKEVTGMLGKMDEIIKESSKLLSYLVVDGISVYEDYQDYISDNIEAIEKIEVIAITYKELVEDVLSSALEYIQKGQGQLDELADKFYKEPDGEAWERLKNLLDGISWMLTTFTLMDQDQRLKDAVLSYEAWNTYATEIMSLKEPLAEFNEAMKNQDNILIADIILYEIKPIFSQMELNLYKISTVGGNSNGLN